ncbi:mannose-1-phosphate guanylyltransferase [Candidatus Cerribacteria bacterium 'Amazon FNV 2010 28 9']|uniref:mannose-1-phosphate guanylyltransferase n=1 Tax=Candidatus Cerribacteria bacterium 'Amazon FNV 2010 28 9' TaxID=2081795 RepID=A0A317JPK9_9BACT|nr:MAG: mannose-1-phosphate guanylyltransferase [Candidatus Cerribacteria bacterium 'Amazon FNV 2010 28 9']
MMANVVRRTMSDLSHTYVVILAGGGGTRLWPKSRNATPKQFLKLYTQNTLMQDTYRRARFFADADHILIISNADYVDEVRNELPELPRENIIGEPAKRETAPAMLLGALLAYKKDPDAVVVNLASDHIATNEQEFQHVIETAITVAARKKDIVTVGITPTFPHSGLGYIEIDGEVEHVNRLPIFRVANFTEKPNVATAKAFIATGKYFWNACNYVWSAETIIEAFRKLSPAILEHMCPISDAIGTHAFQSALLKAYEGVEKIAIDYAISEKADNLVLIPGDFGWNDIGDWKVVYDLQHKNDAGNVVMSESKNGELVCHDSHNNLIHTHDRLIALVGMNDTIVIDTGEIILVMPKERSQDVKKVVEGLKEKGEQYL